MVKSSVPLSPTINPAVPLLPRSEAASDTGVLPVRYSLAAVNAPDPSPRKRVTEAPPVPWIADGEQAQRLLDTQLQADWPQPLDQIAGGVNPLHEEI
jgi:hypothetical protein